MRGQKEHKKIERQRQRINKISVGLQVQGVLLFFFFLSLDIILGLLHMQYDPGFGYMQFIGCLYGISLFVWGWLVK